MCTSFSSAPSPNRKEGGGVVVEISNEVQQPFKTVRCHQLLFIMFMLSGAIGHFQYVVCFSDNFSTRLHLKGHVALTLYP